MDRCFLYVSRLLPATLVAEPRNQRYHHPHCELEARPGFKSSFLPDDGLFIFAQK